MSTTKTAHTPGPWILAKYGAIRGGETRELVGGPVKEQIAMACVIGDSQEANARLIAAAPEMLEALESIRTLSAYMNNGAAGALKKIARLADAAIRKAGAR